MSKSCTDQEARQFWSQRPVHAVANYKDVVKKQQAYQTVVEEREQRHTDEKAKFMEENKQRLSADLKQINKNTVATVENLKFWTTYNSWSFCKKVCCYIVKNFCQAMTNDLNRNKLKHAAVQLLVT
jgi:hypothetical protein